MKKYLVPELKLAPEKSTEREEEPPGGTLLPDRIVPVTVPLIPPPRTVVAAMETAQFPEVERENVTWLPPLKTT